MKALQILAEFRPCPTTFKETLTFNRHVSNINIATNNSKQNITVLEVWMSQTLHHKIDTPNRAVISLKGTPEKP